MMDIQEKLKEIGPFVPGADDDMLICRCEEPKAKFEKPFTRAL